MESVRRKLDTIVSGNNPVTALLVARSAHALTAITHLQQRGLRIPKDLSFLSRDNDAFLDFVVPQVTRYALNPSVFARRVSRVVLQMNSEGLVSSRQALLMPELLKGETLEPVRT